MLLWQKVGEIKFKFFSQSTNNKIYWNVHVLQMLMAKLIVQKERHLIQLLNGKVNQLRGKEWTHVKKGDNLVENVGIIVLLTSGYSHNSCNLCVVFCEAICSL